MASTTQRSRDRADFREFLRSHRYAPQGRLSRAGMLEERDLDAMMRGSVRPVWRWVWRNVKTADDMELIKRNVRVARRNIDSCKREREEAKTRCEQLEARKQYLLESLRKAKEREKALLANLQAVEREQDDKRQLTGDAKQRELLKRAFAVKNEGVVANVERNARSLRTLLSMDAVARNGASQGPENPVEVLLTAYLQLRKSSEREEDIDFGDGDIAHLRGYGGETLVRWLAEALARADEGSFRGSTEREYAAHVQEHSSSSRDALLQVQAALRQNQKEHIARFTETQATYLKAKQLQGRTSKHVDTALEKSKSGRVEEAIELEMEKAVQTAALGVATQMHTKLKQQVHTSKQQKQKLDEKLELMDSFSRRQHDVVAQINAMCSRNESLITSVGEKQGKLQYFSREVLVPKRKGKSSELLQHWHHLLMEELRAFAGIRLDRVESVIKSVDMAASEHHGAESFRRDLHVPLAEFYINQTKRHEPKNGFARVFRALGVPSYANWSRLLVQLDSCAPKEALATLNDRARLLDQEITEERSGVHAAASSRVQTLLVDLQRLSQSMETEYFPRLEEVMAVNQETHSRTIPRLRTLLEDWYTQSGWTVDVQPRPIAEVRSIRTLGGAPY